MAFLLVRVCTPSFGGDVTLVVRGTDCIGKFKISIPGARHVL